MSALVRGICSFSAEVVRQRQFVSAQRQRMNARSQKTSKLKGSMSSNWVEIIPQETEAQTPDTHLCLCCFNVATGVIRCQPILPDCDLLTGPTND